MLTVLIGSTGAFAQQQQKSSKPAATQTGCPSGYDNCVKCGWDIHKLRLAAIAPVDAGGSNPRE